MRRSVPEAILSSTIVIFWRGIFLGMWLAGPLSLIALAFGVTISKHFFEMVFGTGWLLSILTGLFDENFWE